VAHNHKYGQVTLERGDIASDEPVFLLRSRDPLAVAAIAHYVALRVSAGVSPAVLADLAVAVAEMRNWQAVNGTRLPDGEGDAVLH
jgi:hypothetical protein